MSEANNITFAQAKTSFQFSSLLILIKLLYGKYTYGVLLYLWLVCALSHYNINSHSIAFSFDTRGAKEKASQKEKRRFSLSLFEKSSAKTFLDRSLRDVQNARPHCLVGLYVCVISCRLSRHFLTVCLLLPLYRGICFRDTVPGTVYRKTICAS